MTAKGLKIVNDDLDLIEPDLGEGQNETCSGVVCLPGSPSTMCRRSTAPEISQGLMSVATECCPLWTCTFPSNGSLYYVHSGMTTLTRYWASSIKKFDVAFMTYDAYPLVNLPVLSTTIPPKGMLESKSAVVNTSELLLQVFTGEMEISGLEGMKEDGWCEGVSCYPPRAPSCIPAPDPDNNLAVFLGLSKSCCPLYACKSNSDRFLLFSFGTGLSISHFTLYILPCFYLVPQHLVFLVVALLSRNVLQ